MGVRFKRMPATFLCGIVEVVGPISIEGPAAVLTCAPKMSPGGEVRIGILEIVRYELSPWPAQAGNEMRYDPELEEQRRRFSRHPVPWQPAAHSRVQFRMPPGRQTGASG